MILFGSILVGLGYFFMGPSPFVNIEPAAKLTIAFYILCCSGLAFVVNPMPSILVESTKQVGFAPDAIQTSALVTNSFVIFFPTKP